MNPLTIVMGSEVKSRQSILRACCTPRQRTKIQSLGLLLGISQWKDSFLEERVPRNVAAKDEEEDLEDLEEEFNFDDFLGMKKASQTTEVGLGSFFVLVTMFQLVCMLDVNSVWPFNVRRHARLMNVNSQSVLHTHKVQKFCSQCFRNIS